MPTSTTTQTLIQRDREAVWHPFTPLVTSPDPLPVVAAKGCYLYTQDNRRILDAVASWWVNLHGHSNEYIAEAIARQARTMEHVIFAGVTHEPAVQLAERLLQILPQNQKKIFFSDNGSTAVGVALKMSFQYFYNKNMAHLRRKVIALEGSYHGDTFGAMSVGDPSPFNAPFNPYLFRVEFIPFPRPEQEERVWQQFKALIEQGEVAVFIFEPLIQGASGMRTYSPGLLNRMIALAHEHHVICIADEVMTGFGRTGKLFASGYLHQKPDIICLSKGITGGFLPLGATSCTAEIISAYQHPELAKTFFHGHSYTANPIACAAANASLDLLLGDECQQNIQRIGERHKDFARQHASLKNVRQIRTLGTILAIEIDTEHETSYFNEARSRLYDYFLSKDLLLRPLGNVIYVLPPYIISDEELDVVYGHIVDFLQLQ